MSKAIKNFFSLIRRRYPEHQHWLIIHDFSNLQLAEKIQKHGQKKFSDINIQIISLCEFDPNLIKSYLNANVLLMPIYNISKKSSPTDQEKSAKISLRKIIHANPSWFSVITDLSDDFYDFFTTSPDLVYRLNEKIINQAKDIRCINLRGMGSDMISINTADDLHWNNVNGFDDLRSNHGSFYNVMYGEISTSQRGITGKINFTGSIIGSYRLAEALGLIVDPLELSIQNNELIDIKCNNEKVKNIINAFFQKQKNSRELTEIGIGTNLGVKLKGKSLSFEERHPGLHLGFGGMKGSQHVDFVFSESHIQFDDDILFDKKHFLNLSTNSSVDQ